MKVGTCICNNQQIILLISLCRYSLDGSHRGTASISTHNFYFVKN